MGGAAGKLVRDEEQFQGGVKAKGPVATRLVVFLVWRLIDAFRPRRPEAARRDPPRGATALISAATTARSLQPQSV